MGFLVGLAVGIAVGIVVSAWSNMPKTPTEPPRPVAYDSKGRPVYEDPPRKIDFYA